MTFKMSEEAQTITVYNLRADTCEFIGAGDAWIPPHTGLPANCTNIKPPETKSGNVAVFDNNKNKWSIVEDHRGVVVYNINTTEEIYLTDLGPLPENVTSIPPSCEYPKWNGKEWVQDTDALKKAMQEKAEEQRQKLLESAYETTADWRTDLQLGIITEGDKASLIKWVTYIKELKALDFDSVENESDLKSIEWPGVE